MLLRSLKLSEKAAIFSMLIPIILRKTKIMKKLLIFATVLMFQGITVHAQTTSGRIPTLDNLLKLRWTHEIDRWSPYDGRPLYYRGMIIPYQDVRYGLDTKTGKKIPFGSQEIQEIVKNSDSLVFFENFHKNKQKTEHKIINLLTSEILIDQSSDRLIYERQLCLPMG